MSKKIQALPNRSKNVASCRIKHVWFFCGFFHREFKTKGKLFLITFFISLFCQIQKTRNFDDERRGEN